jgi:peptidoglycan hydrolase CwlO-like protein
MNNTVKLAARRTAVTIGVVGSLGLGAATINAASQWTAAAAQPTSAPVSAETLATQLADEEARGTDLQARLEAALAQTAQLQAALDAANAQIGTDGKTARALQAQIAAAQKKLAELNRQAAAAVSPRSVTVVRAAAPKPTPHATTGASGAAGGGDHESGDD